jgi:hypothetical protein
MKASRHRLSGCLSLAVLALAVPTRAEVHVVAPTVGPGVDFTDLQTAINAAAEGDTILVRDGAYGPYFYIAGKSLSVVADGASVRLTTGINIGDPALWIGGLSQGQEVLVRGLRCEMGVAVSQCEGAVWFDEVIVTGDASCGDASPALWLGAGTAVVLVAASF